eukprot:scaffold61982_cov106-Phaeocystis_antarctica.AAC.1
MTVPAGQRAGRHQSELRTRWKTAAGCMISAPNGQGENEKSESRFRRSSFNAFACWLLMR